MNITSAQFIKGTVGDDDIFADGLPQVAFIGRSNVGKSSVINSLTNQKGLARTSSFPGRTQEINLFLINKSFYLVDLPGYGFAKIPAEIQWRIQKMIAWYLLESPYEQKKVVIIIDAKVGPTKDDLDMIYSLEKKNKSVIVVANKIDKIKKSEYTAQMEKISSMVGKFPLIPYSAEKKIGVRDLTNAILSTN